MNKPGRDYLDEQNNYYMLLFEQNGNEALTKEGTKLKYPLDERNSKVQYVKSCPRLISYKISSLQKRELRPKY